MKVYGELESAKLETLTDAQETAATKYTGRIFFNSDDEEVKVCKNDVAESLIPVGVVQDFAGSVAPTGWLFCDGSSLDSTANTKYARLYAVIGTTYGGTGADDFNLPDAKGRMTIGAGAGAGLTSRSLGDTGGAETKDVSHSHEHNHRWYDVQLNYDGGSDRAYSYDSSGNNQALSIGDVDSASSRTFLNTDGVDAQKIDEDQYTDKDSTSGGSATQDVMNPFLALNRIIKY